MASRWPGTPAARPAQATLGRVVRHGVAFTTPGLAASRVPVELVWSPRDPLAVRLGFPESRVVWTLSREAVFDALAAVGRVGEGDVRWFPDPGLPGGLVLELRGIKGSAAFGVCREVLIDFLAATISEESIDPSVALGAWLPGVTPCP